MVQRKFDGASFGTDAFSADSQQEGSRITEHLDPPSGQPKRQTSMPATTDGRLDATGTTPNGGADSNRSSASNLEPVRTDSAPTESKACEAKIDPKSNAAKSGTSKSSAAPKRADASVPAPGREPIRIPVGKFVDKNSHLAENNVDDLFRYIWSRVESKRMIDVVIDMTDVDFIHSRFREELDFLRRHGRSRSIRVIIAAPE